MTGSALTWFKSSYSGNTEPDCVEIAVTPAVVHVRDSKDKDRARLTVGEAPWAEFVEFAAHCA
ncbi:DUF397 domain-containing protein [Streptomyces sp. NPDC048106]|uniref:DUF397 domain-containing protein n=1 Tax=Streptomyces sp. NPDC048106 TaxID=3155750 RepID=UPI003451C783